LRFDFRCTALTEGIGMNHARLAAATLLGVVLAASAVEAQLPSTPRGLGMAGAYMGMVRGQEALWVNPANLGLADAPYWSVGLPQATGGTNIRGPSAGDILSYLLRDDSPERAQELMAQVPLDGMELDLRVRAPLLGFQRRGFAFGIGYGSIRGQDIGRDLVDLMLNGYEDGRTDYRVGKTQQTDLSYWNFAAGYGRAFGPVSIGVTGHHFRGGRVARARMFEPDVDVAAGTIEVDYVEVAAPSASGFAVDVGVAIQPVPGLTAGASLLNASSSMAYGRGLRVRDVTITRADLDGDPEAFWDVRSRLRESERSMDVEASSLKALEAYAGLRDDIAFPRTLQVGAAYSLPTRTVLTAGYRTELDGGRMAAWWSDMASIGIQQKLPLISLRAGYATDLADGSMVSGGLSLGPMHFGVARVESSEAGFQRSGWIGSFGMSMQTTGLASYARR
jgi:hypothetical protein